MIHLDTHTLTKSAEWFHSFPEKKGISLKRKMMTRIHREIFKEIKKIARDERGLRGAKQRQFREGYHYKIVKGKIKLRYSRPISYRVNRAITTGRFVKRQFVKWERVGRSKKRKTKKVPVNYTVMKIAKKTVKLRGTFVSHGNRAMVYRWSRKNKKPRAVKASLSHIYEFGKGKARLEKKLQEVYNKEMKNMMEEYKF